MTLKRNIFFRADAGPTIGYGHFIRSLALADMLKDDFDCVFYTQSPTDYQRKEAASICPLIELPADDTRFELFLNELTGNEIVVLDNYFYTTDYQRRIKEKGCKLVCIDDMHDKHYVADIVVNHAYGCHPRNYSTEPYTQLALGLNYALLRKPFLNYSNELKRNHILVCFGGADVYNLTCKTLHALETELSAYTVDIIIGDAFSYIAELENIQKKHANIQVHKIISAQQMNMLMRQTLVAILPASSVLWEAIFSGCKVLYGYYVDNQTDICKNVGNNKELCLRYIGDFKEISKEQLKNAFTEEIANDNVPQFITPEVKENFVKLFKQEVTVREATQEDAHLYFEWANDPIVRQMSFHTDPIQWDDHINWFNTKINSSLSHLLICYQRTTPIGQVRFDILEGGQAEIDISIAKDFRGQGLGEAMLDAAMEYERCMNGIDSFVAEVKEENLPSMRMFLANGFTQSKKINGICYLNNRK